MTTDLFGTPPANLSSTTAPKRHGRRLLTLGFVASTAAALLVGGMGGTASADISSDSTIANVEVNNTILLSGLTPSFTLTALPGGTVTGAAAVSMAVTTNNLAGYTVTVEAAAPTLAATAVGNTDSIPIGSLLVRQTAIGDNGAFTGLSDASPVVVHTQSGRSSVDGDPISNDYQIAVPFVATDTYSATLNYVATTL